MSKSARIVASGTFGFAVTASLLACSSGGGSGGGGGWVCGIDCGGSLTCSDGSTGTASVLGADCFASTASGASATLSCDKKAKLHDPAKGDTTSTWSGSGTKVTIGVPGASSISCTLTGSGTTPGASSPGGAAAGASSGGSSTSGGTGGSSGGSTAGSSACDTCFAQACPTDYKNCTTSSSPCGQVLQCASGCGTDSACTSNCAKNNPTGASQVDAASSCLQANCASVCK